MKRLLPFLLLLIASPALACDHFVRAYNTAATVDFCLWATDGTAFINAATFEAADVKIMQDEGAEANSTNSPSDEGQCFSLAVAAAELDVARTTIIIHDDDAAWLDKCIVIDTFGNASAQFPTADVNVATISNDAITAASIANNAIGTTEFAAEADVNAEVVDALNVDTYTELTSCPAATASFKTMLQYLYMVGRNKWTQTSSTGTLFRDDGSTGLCTFTDSDAAGTTTRGEGG